MPQATNRAIAICLAATLLFAGQSISHGQNCVPDGQADTNGDCIVDPLDSGYVLARFSCSVGTGDALCDAADANGDGEVDPLDSGFVLARFCAGGTLPEVAVDPPFSPTAASFVTLTGTTRRALSVEISGGAETLIIPTADCVFSADVNLQLNAVNNFFLTGIAGDGEAGIPVPISIVQDFNPPDLFIDFPADGAELTTSTTSVAGRVSDTLSGFLGLIVTVNKQPAEVDVGQGTNGTFFLSALPLELGDNIITAKGNDILGNTASTSISVTRVEIPPDSASMTVVSGDGQAGPVNALLADPIVIRMTSQIGKPLAGKLVTFDVTRSNGRLSTDGLGSGAMLLQTFTDSIGEARAFWTLGSDTGCGNNRVELTSKDILGTTVFCASAAPGPASRINIGSGAMQRAEVGGPAPERLIAWVNDSINPIANVPVIFTVTRSNGLVNGEVSTTVDTDLTGHAIVNFTLGTEPGNNLIEADFAGNLGNPALFVVYGVERDPLQPTTLTGVVFNNAQQPIQGATVFLEIDEVIFGPVTSDLDGRFFIDNLTQTGPSLLEVDGSTAFHVGGSTGHDVPLLSYPFLHFTPIIVPNAENTLSMPVRLPALNPSNSVLFDNSQDVELTVEGVAGLRFIVRAGSMTNADGTVPSPENPAVLSINPVQAEDVPMPLPDGAWNPYAGTLQPTNAHFDPPVEIIWPNFMGLPGGAIANFMSFDHLTHRFEIVATCKVTDDGLSIVSDPGVGISVAGWHAANPPFAGIGFASGGAPPPPPCLPPCDTSACEACVDGVCVSTCEVADDPCAECILGQCSTCGLCEECEGGECVPTCGECEVCTPQGCALNPEFECPEFSGSGKYCCPENCEVCVADECVSTCDDCSSCIEGNCVSGPGGICCTDEDCEDSDSDPCTSLVCQDSQCVTAPSCPPSDVDCKEAICQDLGDGSAACGIQDSPDGEDCADSDSDPCTTGECQAGACLTVPTCPPSSNPCQDSVCNDLGGGTSSCGTIDLPDGTPCESDADQCTQEECIGGVCTATFFGSRDGECCDDSDCDEAACQGCVDGLCESVCEPFGVCCDGACCLGTCCGGDTCCSTVACEGCNEGTGQCFDGCGEGQVCCEGSCCDSVCQTCQDGACLDTCDEGDCCNSACCGQCQVCDALGTGCVDVCNPLACEICAANGACVSACQPNCEVCDAGECVSQCDEALCEECLAGSCVDSCGPTITCCGGVCCQACEGCDNNTDQCTSTCTGGGTCCGPNCCDADDTCCGGSCCDTENCATCESGICLSLCAPNECCTNNECVPQCGGIPCCPDGTSCCEGSCCPEGDSCCSGGSCPVNCNCYFAFDCVGGFACDYGAGGPACQESCNWRSPKPNGEPGAGCTGDSAELGGCDGTCASAIDGSQIGWEDPKLVAMAIELWRDAILLPSISGGGPIDEAFAAQALALPFQWPPAATVIGRHVAGIIDLATGSTLDKVYCAHEVHGNVPGIMPYYVDLSRDPCRVRAAYWAINGLHAEMAAAGTCSKELAELSLACPEWQGMFQPTCPHGENALECFSGRITDVAVYLSTPVVRGDVQEAK